MSGEREMAIKMKFSCRHPETEKLHNPVYEVNSAREVFDRIMRLRSGWEGLYEVRVKETRITGWLLVGWKWIRSKYKAPVFLGDLKTIEDVDAAAGAMWEVARMRLGYTG